MCFKVIILSSLEKFVCKTLPFERAIVEESGIKDIQKQFATPRNRIGGHIVYNVGAESETKPIGQVQFL